MKLNRFYYVWIDPASGHIWNDEGYITKSAAIDWMAGRLHLKRLKLKKIKIVEVKPTKNEKI